MHGKTKTTSHTLRPATSTPSPVTCLAISVTSATTGILYAGSWDRDIYGWPLDSSKPSASVSSAKAILKGHTDFIKALLVIPATSKDTDPLLVSASADKSIIVWNAKTFQRLHTIVGHARGVLALALDPLSLPEPLAPAEEHAVGAIVASGDSNREMRFWRISATSAFEISAKAAAASPDDAPSTSASVADTAADESDDMAPLIVHETSIFSLAYNTTGDIVTASADRTAKLLTRHRDFAVDTSLPHSDYVKCVVVAEDARIGGTNSAIVTGSRDEDVRVWDSTSGKCVAVLRGHWDEVTGLAVVHDGTVVVSVSIDGTVRRWGMSEQDVKRAVDAFEAGEPKKEEKKTSMLTEDEERELAEMMDDD
jgi:WD40 repeat protein